MKTLLAVVSVALLSACSLPQNDPKTQGVTDPIKALVTMEDVIVGNQGGFGQVIATFEVDNKKKLHNGLTVRERAVRGDIQAQQDVTIGGTPCKKMHYKLVSGGTQATPPTYVSMGKVLLAATFQNKSLELKPDEKNVYFADIQPGFPSGAYIIAAEGKPNTPGFQEAFSMPELLKSPRVNGFDAGSPGAFVKKTMPMKIQWLTPTFPNAQNVIFIQVVARTTDRQSVISCADYEDRFRPVGNEGLTLEVLPSDFSEFPAATELIVYLTRAHLMRGPKNPALLLEMEGSRTVYQKISWEN